MTGSPFPAAPRIGVSCAVMRGRSVLLVQRGKAPALGRWAFPGGSLELGESLSDAAAREVTEETGLEVTSPRFVMLHELVERDGDSVTSHFVLATHVAGLVEGGEPEVADDADDARFVPLDRLAELDVVETVLATLRRLGLVRQDAEEQGANTRA